MSIKISNPAIEPALTYDHLHSTGFAIRLDKINNAPTKIDASGEMYAIRDDGTNGRTVR